MREPKAWVLSLSLAAGCVAGQAGELPRPAAPEPQEPIAEWAETSAERSAAPEPEPAVEGDGGMWVQPGDGGAPTLPADVFTVVVMPDTQGYVGSDAGAVIFRSQAQWVASNRVARNIVMVSHLGDIVQTGSSAEEWDRAKAAMEPVVNMGAPYTILPGNHDDQDGADRWLLYSQHFPVSSQSSQPWWGDAYDASNSSQYVTFTVGAARFLVVSLRWWPSSAVITWANQVIQSHPDHKVIVATHGYLDASGERRYGTTSFEYIWTGLVVPNPNVFMVICGHDITGGEALRVDTVGTRRVYQLLSNYQTRARGGLGLLRLMSFSPSQQRIYVQTYSTWLDERSCLDAALTKGRTAWRPEGCYEVDANSELELDVTGQGLF